MLRVRRARGCGAVRAAWGRHYRFECRCGLGLLEAVVRGLRATQSFAEFAAPLGAGVEAARLVELGMVALRGVDLLPSALDALFVLLVVLAEDEAGGSLGADVHVGSDELETTRGDPLLLVVRTLLLLLLPLLLLPLLLLLLLLLLPRYPSRAEVAVSLHCSYDPYALR